VLLTIVKGRRPSPLMAILPAATRPPDRRMSPSRKPAGRTRRLPATPVETPSPRDVPAPLAGITGYLVNRLADRLRQATVERLRDPRIQLRQIGLLLTLREQGSSQQQALGERLGMDRTTTMQLVTRLAQDGLVTRRPDPSDGRAYVVQLTPEGGRVANQVETDVARSQRDVLAALTPAETATFHRLLTKLLADEGMD
jgi:DNA-binding MarR family transcriptional regulator